MDYMPKQSIKYLITLLLIVLSSCFVIHLFFEYLGVLIVSFIIAFSMNPLVHFFERKIKLKKEISVTIVFFLLMGILGFLIFVLGDRLVEEIYSLYKSIPDYILEIKKIVEDIIQRIESLPYNIDVNDAIKNFDYQKYILKFTDTVIDFGKSLPDMIVHFVFSVLFIFFFMLKMDKILSFIESKFQKETYERTKGKLKTILVGYFVAQFKLFLIMFVFLLISFTILDLPYNILLALITSFLDSLPVFGIGIRTDLFQFCGHC
jgi:predicted PurR-regulated permease PerM